MIQNDSYLGNPNVKRDGIVQTWTQNEIQEYARCMNDPSYFAKKYCKIISLDKNWAEAWNKRATVLYLMGEFEKSQKERDKVLSREK